MWARWACAWPPLGGSNPNRPVQAFSEQIEALAKAGVDLLIIETMSDLLEINEAIQAAREVAPQLPVIASMTFTRDDRTLLGDSPAKVAQSLHQAGATVMGSTARAGPTRSCAFSNRCARPSRAALFGHAKRRLARTGRRADHVPGRAGLFWRICADLLEAGTSVIGGCCGTTPQHIAAMARAIQTGASRHAGH